MKTVDIKWYGDEPAYYVVEHDDGWSTHKKLSDAARLMGAVNLENPVMKELFYSSQPSPNKADVPEVLGYMLSKAIREVRVDGKTVCQITRRKISVDDVPIYTKPFHRETYVPSGWKLLPEEITEEMMIAARDVSGFPVRNYVEMWSAALRASPLPPLKDE